MGEQEKRLIKFSTVVDDKRYFTQIDPETDQMIIKDWEDNVLFDDTLVQFKEFVAEDFGEAPKHYQSILNLGEYLVDALSKK